ncbi:hypothetical protein [Hallella colorans]|uniref:hypothetical protein n=1 Tax=Hallella colorans TaxID=1703337 RepID=UPI002889E86E|nr:hypothetical protein [Hallella colorans]
MGWVVWRARRRFEPCPVFCLELRGIENMKVGMPRSVSAMRPSVQLAIVLKTGIASSTLSKTMNGVVGRMILRGQDALFLVVGTSTGRTNVAFGNLLRLSSGNPPNADCLALSTSSL